MRKVMFIVYHDIRTEARSQEILECAKRLGETVFVSYSKPFHNSNCKCIVTGNGVRNYFAFLRESIKAIKIENPDVVVLHDNYTAAILRWLHKHRKNTYIVYDSSELYIDIKHETLKSKIASHMEYFEKKYLKYADIVIAASIERANLMKDYFELNEIPIVFDNMHRIDDDYNIDECEEKFQDLLRVIEHKFHIIYAGGIAERRLTFQLVEAVGELGEGYYLTIVGFATPMEKKKFIAFVNERKYKNINYLGFVSRAELKFLFKKSQASVSAFMQDTINAKYCASGKLYESLFEGIPVITSDNPPFKVLCDKYKIGVCGSDFKESILQLYNNYDYYKKAVEDYISTLNYDSRVENLRKTIMMKLNRSIKKNV